MFDNWYVVQVRTGKEEEIVKKCQFYIDHDILIDCFIPITKKKKKYHGTQNRAVFHLAAPHGLAPMLRSHDPPRRLPLREHKRSRRHPSMPG